MLAIGVGWQWIWGWIGVVVYNCPKIPSIYTWQMYAAPAYATTMYVAFRFCMCQNRSQLKVFWDGG
jgi:hypothetical protein